MPWTQFMDMHSGGGSKEDQQYIYIEAPGREAVVIFYNRFGHNPHRVTCTCCGSDYSISESATLDEATQYERGKRTVQEYMHAEQVLFIRADQITDDERQGDVPDQGYVWVG